MILSQDSRDKLNAPMPKEAITKHPTKTFLSTIKAIYIVERLNDVFGVCGWDIETEIVKDDADYVSMKGRITILDPEQNIIAATPYQYGGHKKTGTNTEPADGYKSAVTDCQSKCASYLEIGIEIFKGLGPQPEKKPAPKLMTPAERETYYSDLIKACDTMHDDEIFKFIMFLEEKKGVTVLPESSIKAVLVPATFQKMFNEFTEEQK